MTTPAMPSPEPARCPHCGELLRARAALNEDELEEALRLHLHEAPACREAERRGRYMLFQPEDSTPGPFHVVGDPWDRSGTHVVGRVTLPGSPPGDPHVSPPVLSTDALGECPDCDEGRHTPARHRADARLGAGSAEMFDLLLRLDAAMWATSRGISNPLLGRGLDLIAAAQARAQIADVLDTTLAFNPFGPTGMQRGSDITCGSCGYELPAAVALPLRAHCPACAMPDFGRDASTATRPRTRERLGDRVGDASQDAGVP